MVSTISDKGARKLRYFGGVDSPDVECHGKEHVKSAGDIGSAGAEGRHKP